jgi:hypothetical protein
MPNTCLHIHTSMVDDYPTLLSLGLPQIQGNSSSSRAAREVRAPNELDRIGTGMPSKEQSLGRQGVSQSSRSTTFTSSGRPRVRMSSTWKEMVPDLRHALVLLLWYASSSAAVLLSKHVFSNPFPYPLAVTGSNNFVAAVLSVFAIYHGRSNAHGLDRRVENQYLPSEPPDGTDSGRRRSSGSSLLWSALGKRRYLFGGLIGAATATEIGLANIALQKLSVSFSTILKATAPLSIVIWSAVLGVAPLSRHLMGGSLALIVGVGFASAGQAIGRSAWLGVALQVIGSVVSGLRWTMTQVYMGRMDCNDQTNKDSDLVNSRPSPFGSSPFETILATAPYTMLFVMPVSLFLEGHEIATWLSVTDIHEKMRACQMISSIGLLVFVLLWAEYELIRTIGAVSVSVLFVVKELLTLIGGKVVFKDRLTGFNVLGFVISQAALAILSHHRRTAAPQSELPR